MEMIIVSVNLELLLFFVGMLFSAVISWFYYKKSANDMFERFKELRSVDDNRHTELLKLVQKVKDGSSTNGEIKNVLAKEEMINQAIHYYREHGTVEPIIRSFAISDQDKAEIYELVRCHEDVSLGEGNPFGDPRTTIQ